MFVWNYRIFLNAHIDNNTNAINIKFLLGDYDEKHWGQLLAKDERKKKRDAEVQEIFAAFRMVAVELINRIHNEPQRFSTIPLLQIEKMLDNLHVEIIALITMINDALRVLSISYRYSVPYIRIDTKYYRVLTNNFAKSDLKMSGPVVHKVEAMDTEMSEMDEDTQIQVAIAASLTS